MISDNIGFKRFLATNFNNYLRQHMSSLISSGGATLGFGGATPKAFFIFYFLLVMQC
jgi:hypothetical protein